MLYTVPPERVTEILGRYQNDEYGFLLNISQLQSITSLYLNCFLYHPPTLLYNIYMYIYSGMQTLAVYVVHERGLVEKTTVGGLPGDCFSGVVSLVGREVADMFSTRFPGGPPKWWASTYQYITLYLNWCF
jgi:hypothetical protein